MATKSRNRLAKVEAAVQEQVELVDEKIGELEQMLRPYERIKEEIDKLRSARRALLGGTRTTGGGGSKIRQEDIVEFLSSNPGSSPAKIAEALGTSQPTISSHLYRGKDERFLTRDKRWWLRDPKNGINSVEDIKEE